MNYNSVVTFVYEVRTSTYIVKIWWTPGPILQLLDKWWIRWRKDEREGQRVRQDKIWKSKPAEDVLQTKHGKRDVVQTA